MYLPFLALFTPSHTFIFPADIVFLQNEKFPLTFISFSVGFLVRNCLSFCLYKNIFNSCSFVKNISLAIEYQVKFFLYQLHRCYSTVIWLALYLIRGQLWFLSVLLCRFSSYFYDFSSPMVFSNLIMIYIVVIFFVLLRVRWSSWTCGVLFYVKFEDFSTTVSSKQFFFFCPISLFSFCLLLSYSTVRLHFPLSG